MAPIVLLCLFLAVTNLYGAESAPVRMPPVGIPVPPDVQSELSNTLSDFHYELVDLTNAVHDKPALADLVPDVLIYYQAVQSALAQDLFYTNHDFADAKRLLAEGRERARLLGLGKPSWTNATGLVVRGYVSRIDGSVQPYGLVVPEGITNTPDHPRRLDFWFHGRNERLSELSFLHERQSRPAEFTPPDTLVLLPYGRYCNASKFAGEVDAFEALDNVRRHYAVDENRIVIRGFSMGGASVWHLAAHYAWLWAAASPGAGFVDTSIYMSKSRAGWVPPWYEERLWHLYDVPDYAANLCLCPVVAFSGEVDPQKQAADLMAEAMAWERLPLVHIIGPNTGHKYEPHAKTEVARRVDALAAQGRNPLPSEVRLVTYSLRYNQNAWVIIDGMEQHWNQARVEADILGNDTVNLTTTNVTALTLAMPAGLCPLTNAHVPNVVLDHQLVPAPAVAADRSWRASYRRVNGAWQPAYKAPVQGLQKVHGLQGPIDDAFMDSFLIVRPTGHPLNAKVGAWATNAMVHAIEAWRLQFRGEPRVKNDTEVTDADITAHNLILWGDPHSNRLLARMLPHLPLQWDAYAVRLGGQPYTATDHLPVFIYPNPLNPKRYVVLNSGFTFASAAPISNALQVPQLPDFAMFDIAAGRIVDAGFFDESWQFPILQ